jgi:hypothetical protein
VPGVALARTRESLAFTSIAREDNFARQQIRGERGMTPNDVTFPSDVSIGGVQVYLREHTRARLQPQIGDSLIGYIQL